MLTRAVLIWEIKHESNRIEYLSNLKIIFEYELNRIEYEYESNTEMQGKLFNSLF